MRLDQSSINWIEDRFENREGLFYTEFLRFMRELGATDKQLKKYQTLRYKNAMKEYLIFLKHSNFLYN